MKTRFALITLLLIAIHSYGLAQDITTSEGLEEIHDNAVNAARGIYKYNSKESAKMLADPKKASRAILKTTKDGLVWEVPPETPKPSGSSSSSSGTSSGYYNNTGGNSNYATPSRPTKGKTFTTKATRDADIQADQKAQREKAQQEATENAQRIEKESSNLRSQMRGTSFSDNTLGLRGVNENSGLALRGVGNNSVTARIPARPAASTNDDVQFSERPAKANKLEKIETIGKLSQKDALDKTIDASEELLSSMLDSKFKPEEYHLEVAVKQTIHSGVINPIKESAKEAIKDGALDNSLLRVIPKESMTDEIKKEFINMFNSGVNELQLIKLNYFDYERIQENILALTKVEEKVVPNIWEYDKRAIIGTIRGTRSEQQNDQERGEMTRKNLNTISEETRKTLK